MKKTAKMLMLLAVLVLMTLTTGCATYGAKGVMPDIKDPSSQIDKAKLSVKKEGNLTVSMYPLTTKEEEQMYFDEDLSGDGVLALFLEIQNEEEAALIAASLNLDGIRSAIAPMAPEDVYGIMRRDPWGRGIFWYFFGAYIGAPISAYNTSKTNEEIEKDLKERILSLDAMPKGVAKGFMCFKIPKSVKEKETSSSPTLLKGTFQMLFQKEMKLIEFSFDINK